MKIRIQDSLNAGRHLRLSALLVCLLFSGACVKERRRVNSSPTPESNRERSGERTPGEKPKPAPTFADDPAKSLAGKVVGVHDGDTITVLDVNNAQYKIRLSGIDAPETCQDFGRKAKERMSDLVFGRQVTVLHDKVDRYGRIVGKVLVDGQDANLAMIVDGLAWHFKKYEKEQPQEDRVKYSDAEQRARQERRGLWLDPNPIPPWDFRNIKKCRGED